MRRHGGYCETMHSMQKYDKTYQHTMHTLTGKRMWDNAPLHCCVIGHVIKLRRRHRYQAFVRAYGTGR
jgi:hypothetical protein